MSIKFSVLVPVYKVENYLKECIDSIINQTYEDWELILVDDGSPDNSGKICDEYALKYEKISVFHKKNEGLLLTRRFAFKQAKGDYSICLDSDDYFVPDALEIIADNINKYNADCVLYNCSKIDNNGKLIKEVKRTTELYFAKDNKAFVKKVVSNFGYNSIVLKAVKSSCIGKENLSNYSHVSKGEDYLQTTEVLKNCQSAVFLPDCLYMYRVNPNSITHQNLPENYSLSFDLDQMYLKLIDEKNLFSDEEWIDYRTSMVKNFSLHIAEICSSSISYRNKIRVLKEMKNDDYYTDFISGEKKLYLVPTKFKIFYIPFTINLFLIDILFATFWRIIKN